MPAARPAILVALLALLVSAGRAHPPGGEEGRVVPRSGPIFVDGMPDEAAWDAAPPLDDFVERGPRLRADPPVRTVVKLLYDEEALYVATWCYQPDPPVARVLNRDTFELFDDDTISLKLDMAHDHRTTLGFALNAAGGRMDYRGVNESDWQLEFDAIWEGRAAVFEGGWTTEFRIPWTELGVSRWDPPEVFGFNVSRDHSRRSATYDWALMPPPWSPISASVYGHIRGLDALPALAARAGGPGERSRLLAWQLSPWALGGFDRTREVEGGHDTGGEYDAGLDAGLRFSGGWSTQLTLNTDFAEVELDDQVVNLSRFSIFLPEKRDFFLEDADVFAFGRQGSAQLFHSRRIGLDEGRTVPILSGLKAVGPAGPGLRVGALDVVTRPSRDLPWTSHLVVRAQQEVGGGGSNLGVMVTQRQSLEDHRDWNLAAGVDGAWRGGDSPLLVEGFALLSGNGAEIGEATGEIAAPDDSGEVGPEQGPGLGGAAALDATWRGELVRPTLSYAYFSEDLRADLGFFQRRGIHESGAGLTVEPRFERRGLERLTLVAEASTVADEDGYDLLDWSAGGSATLHGELGWSVGLSGDERRETVRDAFTVGPGVEIADGAYRMSRGALTWATPNTAVAGTTGTLGLEEYYGGDMLRWTGGAFVRPGTYLRLDASTEVRRVRFPDDPREDFTTAIVNGQAWIGFSPDLNLRLAVQWNDLVDLVRLQARLRWTWRPGSDLFVVYQTDLGTRAAPTSDFHSLLAKITLRIP